jgi:hypothetical protein
MSCDRPEVAGVLLISSSFSMVSLQQKLLIHEIAEKAPQ